LEHYRNYLKILARTHIGPTLQSKADPSDLVQDTLIEAQRDFEQFRGSTEAEFVAWLRTMMANNGAKFVRHYKGVQARDVRREQRIQLALDQSTQMMARLALTASSPSERAAQAEEAVHLADALAQLPSHYRDAIVLYHLQGRTIKDVAQEMDRAEDSIKKLLARAIIALRATQAWLRPAHDRPRILRFTQSLGVMK
jgi:RNA polymerase sigma-70 factor (ECF subfamily)